MVACLGQCAERHLGQIYKHDANLVVVSSAPIEDIRCVKAARGWSFTWPSAQGNRFNQDFGMSTDRDRASQQVGSETVFYERGETGGINAFVRTTKAFSYLRLLQSWHSTDEWSLRLR
ncbi:MAG: hypothetical protein CM15mP120_28570 [Pseudomonadota bacterium]|nr:MAG: hypothetical protein CM15mP120_28570 [Pseudomonadota bacterium]